MRPPVLMFLPLLLGAVAALGRNTQIAPAQNVEGRTIQRIDFDPPNQPLPRDELDRLLPLRVGSPLHQADVRQSLQKLFDTGRFADVAIDAEPMGDGVALRVATQLSYFVAGLPSRESPIHPIATSF